MQSVCRTSLRIWGNPGETITVRIDVRDSYDLQDKKLSFDWHTVYPNQRNVRIEPDEVPGVWKIKATHDPNLPKGRIPVMLVARNGGRVPSNPAFVNFYWPERNEKSDWPHGNYQQQGPKRVYDVTQNQRPRVDIKLDGDSVWCRPGDIVRIPIRATDPEGFPVAIFRRPEEVGTVHGNEFVHKAPASNSPRVSTVHLIYSDGTGGYASTRFKIFVDSRVPLLPDGWRATTIGVPRQAGAVSFEEDTFRIAGVAGQGGRKSDDVGMFAYRPVSSDVDLICEIREFQICAAPDIEPRGRTGDPQRILRASERRRGDYSWANAS